MTKTNFISLFSGAGGLDLGLETAGWEGLYASDIDARAVETLTLNRGREIASGNKFMSQAVIECADVRNLHGREILEKVD